MQVDENEKFYEFTILLTSKVAMLLRNYRSSDVTHAPPQVTLRYRYIRYVILCEHGGTLYINGRKF